MVYQGWLGNKVNTMLGTGMLYVGGVPGNAPIPKETPIRRSLEFDVDKFSVNLM